MLDVSISCRMLPYKPFVVRYQVSVLPMIVNAGTENWRNPYLGNLHVGLHYLKPFERVRLLVFLLVEVV